MHSLITLSKIEDFPFYARRANWSKAYVRVDKVDIVKKIAFGEYFYMKKSDGLISGASSFDWLVFDKE